MDSCIDVEFAHVERFTAWGSAVLSSGRRKAVSVKVAYDAAGFRSCDRCQTDFHLASHRLLVVGAVPEKYLPVNERLRHLLSDDRGNVSKRKALCGECLDLVVPGWREALRSTVAATADEPAARPQQLSTSTNIGLPKRYAEEEKRAEPRFSGMCLQISDKLAAALALTPHRPDAKPIGEEFSVQISPQLGPMALIRMVGDKWSAHAADGSELDLDDARVPVLRNIAFGACDLLAGESGGGPTRIVEEADEALPVKLIRPTHLIKVKVGADFRELVVEIIEGKRSYETTTTEAIFVRGHWVRQPCGDGRRERKLTWRQPHYRGRGAKGGRTYELEVNQ